MTMDVVDGTGYRLELDYEAPLLRASVSGGHDTGLAVSREYWLRILDHARACGASQLLVLDGMQGEVMGDEDLQRFFDAIEGRVHAGLRMAYVEGRADQIPRIEYAELLARERGYTVRIFNNETDALVWLRHGMR
ncbi:hypothetical protein [Thermomonas sp.]|jgi:hypothetical protein|uniref:hypothetical protein n=1 Tax=Thermomonas sp. TaxID=1971895 RepID=UPI001B707858|nr:hypothetical protein [Thermomonas sp.]MBK6332228.1 hypothetical protein [Thermomonas sp.]MBK6417158.1 hypothetical protein [Thermomonas sp.]MBK6924387.1 hypothetical protein [Thermomonas sp.]MBK7204560.1 hypothetical protein [Thermomonas sp.]MBK9668511.1 hypothetical protein [Thermomonas sp.]